MSAENQKRLSKPQRDYIRRIYPLGYSMRAIALALGVREDRVRTYLQRAPKLQLRRQSPSQASLPPLQAFTPRPQCGKRHVDEHGNPRAKVRTPEWWDAPKWPGWRVHGEVVQTAKASSHG